MPLATAISIWIAIAALIVAFVVYKRSSKFKWSVIFWILGIIAVILLFAYLALLNYARGWQF